MIESMCSPEDHIMLQIKYQLGRLILSTNSHTSIQSMLFTHTMFDKIMMYMCSTSVLCNRCQSNTLQVTYAKFGEIKLCIIGIEKQIRIDMIVPQGIARSI